MSNMNMTDTEMDRSMALSDLMMRTISEAGADPMVRMTSSIVLPAIAYTAARIFTLAPPAEFETALREFLGGVEAIAKQLQLDEKLERTKTWLSENLERDPDNL
jgi:hypothetical protein